MAKETIFARAFNSLSEYERHLTAGTIQPAFAKFALSLQEGASAERFAGTTDYETANGLLMYGDRETAKTIETNGLARVRASLRANAQTIRTEASVVGFMPHVPNFIAGVPLTMINATRTERRSRAVSVIYNGAANCYTTTEEMSRAACKVLCAVMKIEAAGRRVNLWASCAVEGHGAQIASFVRVKSSDKKLDPLRCAYAFVNASYFRRHFARFVEIEEGVPAQYVRDYGHAMEGSETKFPEIIKAKRLGIPAAVVIDFETAQRLTEAELIEKIGGSGRR